MSPEITPEKLVEAVESGEEIHVLDVRAPQRLAAGRIDIVPEDRFHNVRGSELLSRADPGIPRGAHVAVVCGLGNDSRRVAAHLASHGYRAESVVGGMAAWNRTVIARELEAPPELDRLVQLDRIAKGALGYLLVSGGEAFVVDPPRFTEAYEGGLGGARLVGVADTHAHADYISGGEALARAHDVPYYLHPADAIYPYDGTPGVLRFRPVVGGERLRVGRAAIEVVHTPGHTEGSVTFKCGDAFALTGDFIFVGSVGRPDLGGKTEEWTKVLFESLRRAKRDWPVTMRIYPAHYGSAAERAADRTVGGALGDLKNEPLWIDDAARFAHWIRSRAGKFPDAYRRIKAINIGLESVEDAVADELESGRNECALK
ncbi:MAG: MBL fold metallo-hydrolase [Planctomycetes bacterium]|nr:MBL fold metallo-hydrolase [Planctomycetota bacterium]